MSLDDQLRIIEWYAEDDLAIDPENIRRSLEIESTRVVISKASERMMEYLLELEAIADLHDLGVEHLVSDNNHGWARHHHESWPEENCTVYHYRNLENERLHIDVYEFSMG